MKVLLKDDLLLLISEKDINAFDIQDIISLFKRYGDDYYAEGDRFILFEKNKEIEDFKNKLNKEEFSANDEIEELRDVLINSNAISCTEEHYEPERTFGRDVYHINYGYRIEVDYNKLAKAIYYAGYKRG